MKRKTIGTENTGIKTIKQVSHNSKKYPCVDKFAAAMKEQLIKNEEKGGWKDCANNYFFARLFDEIGELRDALRAARGGARERKEILHEAADVANFIMMIVDNNTDLLK
jgi:NTP pyrophosphatase (non-canonical NTP hydrolase)